MPNDSKPRRIRCAPTSQLGFQVKMVDLNQSDRLNLDSLTLSAHSQT